MRTILTIVIAAVAGIVLSTPRGSGAHCTLAVTEAFPFNVYVQVPVLFPPLEQAPDQMTSHPLVARSVILVPVANGAEPLVPTVTLMPAGLEVTRS